MNRKNKRRVTAWLGLWLGLWVVGATIGCNYNYSKGAGGDTGFQVDKEAAANPDFKTVMNAVIGPRCLSCHSTLGGNAKGLNLETYAAVSSKTGIIKYRAVTERNMPAGGLSEPEVALLKTWIANGYPETVSVVGEKPDGAIRNGPDNWKKISQVFEKRCLNCHLGPKPDADLDLGDYAATKKAIGKILQRVLGDRNMPSPPLPGLSETEASVLTSWVANQMPRD